MSQGKRRLLVLAAVVYVCSLVGRGMRDVKKQEDYTDESPNIRYKVGLFLLFFLTQILLDIASPFVALWDLGEKLVARCSSEEEET